MKVLFLYPNLQLMQVVPPGLLTLSAYLKKHGIETDIFDTTFYKIAPKSSDEERIDSCQVRPFNFEEGGIKYKETNILNDFQKKIDDFRPDILAITSNDFTHNIAKDLIRGIKEKYPNLFVISGGIFTTFFPDYVINIKDIDAICIGEGYGALLELCQKLDKKQDISNIKNLWVKTNGNIIKNSMRKPISVLEIPVDDYELFDEKRYYRPMQGKMLKMVPIWIDLGCPYNCSYCVAPGIRNLYKERGYNYCRIKPVDIIMDDLCNAQIEVNPDYIYFSTETFFARSKSHIIDFAERYKKEINLPFWCESRVGTITEENCKILKEMNCDRISIGLESGNENYRMNVLKKKFTNEEFLKSIEMLDKYGINATINTIIGLPDETREMIFDSINLNRIALENKKIDVTITVSTYVPCGGTELREYCLTKGYFKDDEYLKMKNTSFHKGAFLTQPSISQEEVKGLLKTFPLYVKMLKGHWDDIKNAEQLDNQGEFLYKELRSIYWKEYFK